MNEQTALGLMGLFPIMLLTVLLVIKELGRAYGWPQSSVWSRVLNFAIAALIPLVVVVLVMRFLYVLGSR
jgi:hypothetical protein